MRIIRNFIFIISIWCFCLIISFIPGNGRVSASPIIVEPGPLDHFDLTVPLIVRVGGDFQVILEARDGFGNLVVDYSTSGTGVNVSTDGCGRISPAEVLPWNFENGRARVYFRYDKPEEFIIVVRECDRKHITGKSASIRAETGLTAPERLPTRLPGEFDHFLVVGPRQIKAGRVFKLIIEARDKDNKLVSDYNLKGADVELVCNPSSPSDMAHPRLVKADSFKQGRAVERFSCPRSGVITIIARQRQPGAGKETGKDIAGKTRKGEVADILAGLDERLKERKAEKEMPAAGLSKTVTLNLRDAEIKDVLRIISSDTGINILVGPDVTGTVTVGLTNVLLENALKSILYSNGYTYIKEDNIYRVVLSNQVTEVFKLKYIDAYRIKDIIAAELTEAGKVEVYSPSQAGWDFGDGGAGSSGNTGEETSATASAGGGTSNSAGTRQALSDAARKSNRIVVTDTANTMARIRQILTGLDVKPKQVLIEAKIVEVNNTLLSRIGVVDFQAVQTTNQDYRHKYTGAITRQELLKGAASSGMINLYKVGILDKGEYMAVLDMIMTDTKSKIISSPLVTTMEHQEATILSGKRVPILTSTTVTGGTISEQVQSVQEWVNVGTQLLVVPQIYEDGSVNLLIHPEVSDIVEYTNSDPPFPIIETRQAESQVFVKSGNTVVIAGLVKKTDVKSIDKIPLLGDIPLLGLLFQRRTIDTEDRDMIIFITPHILTDEKIRKFTGNKEKKVNAF